MFSTKPERLRFNEAYVGLIFEPMATARSLLSAVAPWILLGIILIFLATAFLPVVYVEATTIPTFKGFSGIIGLLILFFGSFFSFVLLECLLLLILGCFPRFSGVFSISVFTLVPATICLLIIFGIDYASTGRLTCALFLTRGEQWFSASQGTMFMYLLAGLQMITFFCFFCYIRVLCSMGLINALFTTVLSVISLSLAISSGIIISKLFCPNCLTQTFRILASYSKGLPFF